MELRNSFLVAVVALLLAVPAAAQGVYVYTVNYVCGFQASESGSAGYEPLVKVANYATKIDFYNPGPTELTLDGEAISTVNQRWPGSMAGASLAQSTLGGSRAAVIDCVNIAKALSGNLPSGKPFYSGVVTVRSPSPLIVWATKTTQVCTGMATVSNTQFPDPRLRPLYIDDNGEPFYAGGSPPPVQAVDLVAFGCPIAEVDSNGNVVVDPGTGTFRGPNGGVPPGLRPIGPVKTPPVAQTPQGGFSSSSVSISTSIDFERVEGVFIE